MTISVGLDLGTSSVKAVALSAGGMVLARARHGYPTARPVPGAAEQDAADWWRAVVVGLRELAGAVPAEQWSAIGLSAMLPTLVPLDDHGQPTGLAITWEDARGEPAAEQLRERVGGDELYRRTGQWVDGRYLLPMTTALADHAPAVAERTTTIAGAKDHLFHRLTGSLMTDPSTAAGYGCYLLAEAAWETAWTDGRALPTVRPATTVLPLHDEAAAELGLPAGIPVVLGAGDSVLGALAAGAVRPGDIAYLCGTSTAVLGLRADIVLDDAHRYLLTPTVDGWAAEADLLATGSALAWLAGLFGLAGGAAELAALAYAADEPMAPLFLPYLGPGEQGALWDPDLRGALLGLHLGHGRADLARALLTGIVLESARCLDLLGGDSPVFAAGRMLSRAFTQDLADATGRPVCFDPDESAHSAVGAALLAARAVGLDVTPPATGRVRAEPRAERAPRWAALFDRHEQLRERVGHVGSGASDDH